MNKELRILDDLSAGNGKKIQFTDLSHKVLGCAIEVHRAIGPGLLESAYQQCLCHELSLNQIRFEIEKPLPVQYKGIKLDCGYRIDILVEDEIIIELKSVEQLLPLHEAQILSYMKLMNVRCGFLINFNVKVLKNGIKSFVL
jgi:GxxExxY protein